MSGALLQVQGDTQPLDCKLRIALAQADPTEIILTISHDEKCKIIHGPKQQSDQTHLRKCK